MNYGLTRLSTRTKLVAAALALALAGVSHAQTTQVGGGATLPSIGYVGTNAASNLQVWGTSANNTVDPIDPNSLFGVYQAQTGNPNVSYCLTGSGAGKDTLAAPITLVVNGVSTSFSVQNTCVKNSVGTVPGFGAGLTGVGRTDLTQPNFAGSDSPLAAADYQHYQTGHGSSAFPTQFPAVAGAVAIGFNVVDTKGVQVTTSATGLSDSMICNILSGQITNWDDTRLTSAFTVSSGASLPNAPINVQYRSDGSGTTFSLSNHLTAVCGAINSVDFQANQAFTSVVAGFFTSGLPNGNGTSTAKWTGASGNPGVASAIVTTANSIGYVETANALATNPGMKFANVNSLSPTANFGTPLAITSAAIVYNQVISATNNTNGTPALEGISSITNPTVTAPPANSTCIALVKPSLYAKPGIPGSLITSTTYPIVAISYLLSHAQGVSSGDLASTQGLVNAAYNSTITGSVNTIGSGTGLAFLNLGTNGAAFGTNGVNAPGDCVNSGQ
ncbi:substrate-binding domain-containing protein [Dyella humi]|uniref:Substrate-binding domain-containing protein n=1 Tax=Dyella humi TaxID=1770547 RepID=A0ABW8IN05_9GAMM